MKKICENLFIGNDSDCSVCVKDSDFAIIHACKTCHQKALNYSKNLPSVHPNYLIYENGAHLFLNMVDKPVEFQPQFTHPMVSKAMEFINNNIKNKKILIHCNQGQSRSPSLGLVYLARNGDIPKDSYSVAAQAFLKLYPDYSPGTGIALYLEHNWDWIINEFKNHG